MAKRLEKPVKLRVGLTEPAYARLRALNAEYGLGNDYLLVVLLEHLDEYADEGRLKAAFETFIAEFGAPPAKGTKDG
ncbi:MAG: hypothetical protein AAF183_06775 [Pseudomonadota bacterium]